MRIGKFLRVLGLVICSMVVTTQACQYEPGKTPPDEQTQQSDVLLEDMQEMSLPTFAPDVKEWLGEPGSDHAKDVLHTTYKAKGFFEN